MSYRNSFGGTNQGVLKTSEGVEGLKMCRDSQSSVDTGGSGTERVEGWGGR